MIRIWATDEASPFETIDTGSGGITHVAFSRDYRWLLCSKFRNNDLQIWYMGEEDDPAPAPPSLHATIDITRMQGLNAIAFSPDGSRIVVAGFERLKIYAFPENGRVDPIPELVIPEGQTFAHFSPDGKQIITCNFETHVKVWDAKTGMLRMTFPEIKKPTRAKFSQDGERWLICCRYEQTSRALWFDSAALLAAANENRWMGALTAYEIDLYQLQHFMKSTGFLDSQDQPRKLIEKGNEEMLFNFAKFYFDLGQQSEDESKIRGYYEISRELFSAAALIGELHLPETYDDYFRKTHQLLNGG